MNLFTYIIIITMILQIGNNKSVSKSAEGELVSLLAVSDWRGSSFLRVLLTELTATEFIAHS